MKTNKSYTKRIKIRKNGSIQARKAGHGHFNAKESSAQSFAKKKYRTDAIIKKNLKLYVPFS